MFACIVRGFALHPRIADYIGDDIGSLVGASACGTLDWAYGTGPSRTQAAEAAIRNAYCKFGVDGVGKVLIAPMGFLVEYSGATGKIRDYEHAEVETRAGEFPLRIRYTTPDGAAQLRWY